MTANRFKSLIGKTLSVLRSSGESGDHSVSATKEESASGKYAFRSQRKVFFAVSSGVCNLQCPYCITNRPGDKQNLNKEDFAFIFDYFGENIYFIFSGLGDFFCGYRAKDELLRYLLLHDVSLFLDINGVDIKELADERLEGREKIDMIDISYHFGAMKKQKVLKRWIQSLCRIHEGGYNYYVKMVPSHSEKDYWEEAIQFYRKEAFPITGKKLMLFPDTNVATDLHVQLGHLEKLCNGREVFVQLLARESLFKKTSYPSGVTPPCPAGSRYFRVLNTGDIMACDPLGRSLGNIKRREVTTWLEDVPCNLTGLCDCGWAINPRTSLLSVRDKAYIRQTMYEEESNRLDIQLPEAGHSMTIVVDRLEEDAQIVKNMRIEGRILVSGIQEKECQCAVVLKSDKHTYVFDTRGGSLSKRLSPGEKDENQGRAFRAFIPKGHLESGNYQVGLYLLTADKVREVLQFTKRWVAINRREGFSILNEGAFPIP